MEAFFRSIVVLFFYFYFFPIRGEEFDKSEKVKAEVGDISIEAEHLIIENQMAHATGNVHFTGENFYARCEEVKYNIESKEIYAQDINMGIDRACISAEKINFSKDQIEIDNAHVCVNLGLAAAIPNLRTEKITYDRNQKQGIARNIRLNIGNVPVMGLPYLSIGDWIRLMDVRFHTGYTSRLGGYFQSEIYYNFYEDLYLGILLDMYCKRGTLIGPILKIDSEGESIVSHLKLKTGYISDHGNKGKDMDGQSIEKCRWFIDMKQNHHFGQKIDFLSDFLWASDGKIEEDFKRLNENSEIRESFGEFDYRGENDLWTLFMRAKMNHYQDFSQQIPLLRYERFPQEIFDSGIYYFSYLEFTHQKSKKEKVTNQKQMESIELDRIDSYFGINRPAELGNGFHITPLVGGKWTHYNGECDRFLGELGFDFNANFYALYPKQIPWLKAKEWKHVIRPIVKYRKISQSSKHTEKPVDKRQKNNFLPCIDLSEMRYVDDLIAQNILRLGLENDFFAKSEKNKIREIASLDFYQDFPLKRHDKKIGEKQSREGSLSDFYVFSELNPRRWFNFRLYSRLHWKHFSIQEVNAETNFLSGDLWQFGFRTKFVKHRIDQLSINFCFHFNEISKFNFETQIDAKTGKFLATEIGYITRLGSVWDVKLFIKIKNHSSRDSRFQPGFLINLMQW